MARWLTPVFAAVLAGVGLLIAAQHGAPKTVHTITVPGVDTGSGALLNGPCRGQPSPHGGYQHVIWILMGTANSRDVLRGQDAVKTKDYAVHCGVALSYTSVRLPSFPNIPALVAGDTGDIVKNRCSGTCPPFPQNLFKQVPNWKVYVGGMKTACSSTANTNYDPRFNPPLWVDVAAHDCKARDVPIQSFTGDLEGGALPKFSILVPGLCQSMTFNRNCVGGVNAKPSDFVSNGDHWLGARLDEITHSKAYAAGSTAVMVTWVSGPAQPAQNDCLTSPNKNCRVATIVLARAVPPNYTSAVPFSHYSLLKTTESLLGVPHLGEARRASVNSMRKPFGL